ncbi:MAG: T9SS type A sorting domain-containing protein [Bacteroidia bacterium]
MKKSLLLATALVSGFTLVAQTGKQLAPNRMQAQKVIGANALEMPSADVDAYPMGLSPKVNNPVKVLVGPPYPLIATTRNIVGTQTSELNTVSYNQDLNAVVVITRFPPATIWPTSGSFISGYMVANWTTDNGQTWDYTNFYRNDTYAGRHPQGVISNPPGNTNLTLARYVGCGPTTDNASNWTSTWFASTPLDGTLGTNHEQTTNDQQTGSNTVAGNLQYNNYFTTTMAENSGTVWTIGYQLTDPVGRTGITGYNIFKGVVGPTGVTWTKDMTTLNGPTLFNTSGTEADCGAPMVAFGPDKMTGYIVLLAADVNPSPILGMRPMVWKTIDAGATWARVNSNFDWSAAMPAAWGNLRANTTDAFVAPHFSNVYGGDIAVDANGQLHYVTCASSQYSNDLDSLGYTYLYDFGYTASCDKPWIIDFTTDGNGSWNGTFIDYLHTCKMGQTAPDTTLNYNPWTPGSVYGYDARIQITRSTDGTKMFYSWSDSDTINSSSVATQFNIEPNIMYQGYDLTSNTYTDTKKVPYANTNTGCWFPCISDFAANPGAGTWQIPMMYTESVGQTFNNTLPAEDYYVDDAVITTGDFAVVPRNFPVCPLFVGINEVHANIASIGNYPNPFSASTTIKIELVTGDDITVNVFNTVGQTVMSKSIKGIAGENNIEVNASNLSEGMYYYSVKVGSSVVTKKMVIQK